MNLLKTAIEIRLESEGKLQENVGNLLRQEIGSLKAESERILTSYINETVEATKKRI